MDDWETYKIANVIARERELNSENQRDESCGKLMRKSNGHQQIVTEVTIM